MSARTPAPAWFALLDAARIPRPVPEYRFAPPRRFRADFCWVRQKLILEVEGGVWTGGRHTHPTGFLRDIDKYNTAAILGYRVIRCTPAQVASGDVLAIVRQALLLSPKG